ncbi:MAG: 2-phospho-L-lactate transferase [Candidatus Bathyarchaeota archaeon]|nr:MAG: 2-phospho-L-lactate transferase [Candidatus Bathyarchaeota archaeon]
MACLAGGVGAAKFLQGLIRILPQENLTVIVNTSDDIRLYGLHVSPDPDIIMYTLSGLVDEKKGWGIQNDSFNCLGMLQKYGCETWFKLGDRDLATHIYRTQLLEEGIPSEEISLKLCEALGVKARILPVTNQRVEAKIVTEAGKMHFEEYLVKRESRDKVLDVIIEGAESAHPSLGVIESLLEADGIIVCPSNPIVSIGPILAVGKIRETLKETEAKIVAVTPIVKGATIKGPADKLMKGLGMEVSPYSVALLYRDFLDVFFLDNEDKVEKRKIESLGVKVVTANTIMRSLKDKIKLAKLVLQSF